MLAQVVCSCLLSPTAPMGAGAGRCQAGARGWPGVSQFEKQVQRRWRRLQQSNAHSPDQNCCKQRPFVHCAVVSPASLRCARASRVAPSIRRSTAKAVSPKEMVLIHRVALLQQMQAPEVKEWELLHCRSPRRSKSGLEHRARRDE
jgi:hypothetical protein